MSIGAATQGTMLPVPDASATRAERATAGASALCLADPRAATARDSDAILETLYARRFELLDQLTDPHAQLELANVEAEIDYWESGVDAAARRDEALSLQQITNQLLAIQAKLERVR